MGYKSANGFSGNGVGSGGGGGGDITIDVTIVNAASANAVLFSTGGILRDDPNFLYFSAGTANALDLFASSDIRTQASSFALFRAREGLTAVQAGDSLGTFAALGYDGNSYMGAARIEIKAGDTISATEMSGAIEFQTDAGQEIGLDTRMWINQNGFIGINAFNANSASDSLFEILTDGTPVTPAHFFSIRENLGSATYVWDLDILGDTHFRHATASSLELVNLTADSVIGLPFTGTSVSLDGNNFQAIMGLMQQGPSNAFGTIYIADSLNTISSIYQINSDGTEIELSSPESITNINWALDSTFVESTSNINNVYAAQGVGATTTPNYTLTLSDLLSGNGVFVDAKGGDTNPYYNIHVLDNTNDNDVFFYAYGITLRGGIAFNNAINTAAGATTVAVGQYYVTINKTVGAATVVNLPVGSTLDAGTTFVIKDGKGDAATNPITVTPNAGAGDLIDGAATYVMNTNYRAINVFWNGTQWGIC